MVNVIGLGYIGLPTALMLASCGVPVAGTDRDPERIAELRSGHLSRSEPGLEALFSEAAGMTFSVESQCADTYILAVPTPCDWETGAMDASYVTDAVEGVLAVCPRGATIVVESTLAPGTVDRVLRPLIRSRGFRPGQDIHLALAPERVIPGRLLQELRTNSRVIGADDDAVGRRVRDLYRTFCQGEIQLTDIPTAEMVKVAENTFRAVNIALSNELAMLCHREGLDAAQVIRLCNRHPRVRFLEPGPGVGGHCIPVAPRFLAHACPDLAQVTAAAIRTNDAMPDYVWSRIQAIMSRHGISDPDSVGLYGMTYKEDADDVRHSPTMQLLARWGPDAGPRVYDPLVTKDLVPNQYHDLDRFLAGAELVVILVGHRELRGCMEKLSGKVVLDCKNVCELPDVYRL